MEGDRGSPETPGPANRAARKRVRKDPGRPAARGSAMTEKIALSVTISKRARMILDNHATLNSGTARGSLSGLIEWLITEHLRSIQIRHMEPGEAPGDPSAGND